MAITRSNAEFMIVGRIGPLLTAADMDGTTVDGTNADLNGALGRALFSMGYSANITNVTDANIAQVGNTNAVLYLDLVELHALEDVLGNLDDVDIRVGPRTEKLAQLAKQVERKIQRLNKHLKFQYGYGNSIITAAYIRRNIAEHD